MLTPSLTYTERSHRCQAPVAKQLLTLMDQKKTNLALSVDVIHASELVRLADQIGPEICVLKTHIDMIEDFSSQLINDLKNLAEKHQFLLFEDRKFADIGNTVKHQYGGGIYHIADWAHLTNAHVLPGPGIIEGLAAVGLPKHRGLILLAEMSSAGHLMDQTYIEQTLRMAEQYPEFVIGFITQHAVSSDAHWINFTPGVNLASNTDALKQQYVTPQKAILHHGSDVVIVGRGILQAVEPRQMACLYREQAWQAYQDRCHAS